MRELEARVAELQRELSLDRAREELADLRGRSPEQPDKKDTPEAPSLDRGNRRLACPPLEAAGRHDGAPRGRAAGPGDRRRRGLQRQQPARLREEQARRQAVEAARQVQQQGGTQREAARRLGISPRSLRRWAFRTTEWVPLGRPMRRAEVKVRQQVIAQLAEWGPRTGVPALRAAFPEVMRAELADLLRRFRRIHRIRQKQWTARLEWTRVGAVWAADFAHPPAPLEGRYPRLISVRDLASGHHLVWRPVADESSRTALATLQGLFIEHGTPLGLKIDNGSAWRSEEVKGLLAERQVAMLYSPPIDPEFNGSVEAGVGAAKGRTEERAQRRGEPGQWTREDVEGARQEGNVFGWSPVDPKRSPEQVWQSRDPLRTEEREALAAEILRQQAEEQQKKEEVDGRTGAAGEEAPRKEASWRVLLRRALGAHGYLFIHWRRISPQVSEKKEDKLT